MDLALTGSNRIWITHCRHFGGAGLMLSLGRAESIMLAEVGFVARCCWRKKKYHEMLRW